MNIAIIGGKTGGHLLPGVALAEHLEQEGHELVFLCSSSPLDAHILQKYSWPFHAVSSSSPRYGLWTFVRSLCKGMWQSLTYLRQYKIDVVVGLGGFPSVPGVLMARILGCKILLLEQNIVWGKANRFLAYLAQHVCVSFPLDETLKVQHLSYRQQKNVEETGNPVRSCFEKIKNDCLEDLKRRLCLDADRTMVLVMGGSQGAQRINNVMQDIMIQYSDIQWVMVTGAGDFDRLEEWKKLYSVESVHLMSFCEDIELWMGAADLVLSRAGANTLSELAVLRKRSVLIPLKDAVENHQFLNAKFYEDKGLFCMFEEDDHLKEELLKYIDDNLMNIDCMLEKPDSLNVSGQRSVDNIFDLVTCS